MWAQQHINYLKKLRWYLGASVLLLGLGAALGVLAIPYAPDLAQNINQGVDGFVKLFRQLAKPQLAAAIFLNNALKTLIVIVGGTLFGIVPVVFLLVNGAAPGFVLYLSIQQRGVVHSVLAILPHGILELPAVLLGTSIGLMLGRCLLQKVTGSAEAALASELTRSIKFFFLVLIPLLGLAAVVESFVTSAAVER